MIKPLVVLSLCTLVVTGCGTRLNPLNWFGGSRAVAVETETGRVNPLLPQRSAIARPVSTYPGVPIDTIETLAIERTLSGAIINVSGLAARQGAYDARLIPTNPEELPVDGVLGYTLEVVYPRDATPVGNPRTREIVVARSLSEEQLAGVRVIRVTAARNARESRR